MQPETASACLTSLFRPEAGVTDWRFAQKSPSEELAQLHFYSFKKCVSGVEVDFTITVKEFATPPPGQHFKFFAQADKEINQKIAPFLPSGWGNSILEALTGCTRSIREFPCEEVKEVATDRAGRG
jgi:hypothetical protein